MARSRPPRTHRYSMQFKAMAVRMSDLPDVLIQDVAEALDIHPFYLFIFSMPNPPLQEIPGKLHLPVALS